MQRKKLVDYIVIGIVAAAVAGYLLYSGFYKISNPSEGDGKQFFADFMDGVAGASFTRADLEKADMKNGGKRRFVEIVKFEKLNAIAGETDGMKFYKMEFRASGTAGNYDPYAIQNGEETPFLLVMKNQPGDAFDAKGELYFDKMEKGWRGNLKKSTIRFGKEFDTRIIDEQLRRQMWRY